MCLSFFTRKLLCMDHMASPLSGCLTLHSSSKHLPNLDIFVKGSSLGYTSDSPLRWTCWRCNPPLRKYGMCEEPCQVCYNRTNYVHKSLKKVTWRTPNTQLVLEKNANWLTVLLLPRTLWRNKCGWSILRRFQSRFPVIHKVFVQPLMEVMEPIKSLIRFTFVIAPSVIIEVTDFSIHLIAGVCSFSRIFLQSVQIIKHSNQAKIHANFANFMCYGKTRIKRPVLVDRHIPWQLRWESLGMELRDYQIS